MTPVDFIAQLMPSAKLSAAQTKIPASFVIAEGALESGWGLSELYIKANNIFGVKADLAWHGDTLNLPTKEFINGAWCVVPAVWRKYATQLECIEDHADFLLTNPRYKLAFSASTANDFVKAIASAGYATDPDYASKIMEIINFHHLTQYDA